MSIDKKIKTGDTFTFLQMEDMGLIPQPKRTLALDALMNVDESMYDKVFVDNHNTYFVEYYRMDNPHESFYHVTNILSNK